MKTLKTYLGKVLAAFKQKGVGGAPLRPKRDWYILVSVEALLLCVFAGIGMYTYYLAQQKVTEMSVVEVPPTTTLDASYLFDVVNAYRARSAIFQELREEPLPIPLPNESTRALPRFPNDASNEVATSTDEVFEEQTVMEDLQEEVVDAGIDDEEKGEEEGEAVLEF